MAPRYPHSQRILYFLIEQNVIPIYVIIKKNVATYPIPWGLFEPLTPNKELKLSIFGWLFDIARPQQCDFKPFFLLQKQAPVGQGRSEKMRIQIHSQT